VIAVEQVVADRNDVVERAGRREKNHDKAERENDRSMVSLQRGINGIHATILLCLHLDAPIRIGAQSGKPRTSERLRPLFPRSERYDGDLNSVRMSAAKSGHSLTLIADVVIHELDEAQ